MTTFEYFNEVSQILKRTISENPENQDVLIDCTLKLDQQAKLYLTANQKLLLRAEDYASLRKESLRLRNVTSGLRSLILEQD